MQDAARLAMEIEELFQFENGRTVFVGIVEWQSDLLVDEASLRHDPQPVEDARRQH